MENPQGGLEVPQQIADELAEADRLGHKVIWGHVSIPTLFINTKTVPMIYPLAFVTATGDHKITFRLDGGFLEMSNPSIQRILIEHDANLGTVVFSWLGGSLYKAEWTD